MTKSILLMIVFGLFLTFCSKKESDITTGISTAMGYAQEKREQEKNKKKKNTATNSSKILSPNEFIKEVQEG